MDTQKAIEYFSGKLERTLSNRRRQAYEVALEALEKQEAKAVREIAEHQEKPQNVRNVERGYTTRTYLPGIVNGADSGLSGRNGVCEKEEIME